MKNSYTKKKMRQKLQKINKQIWQQQKIGKNVKKKGCCVSKINSTMLVNNSVDNFYLLNSVTLYGTH